MKVQLYLLLALVVFFVAALDQDGDPQIYCGRKLAIAMAKLCYINYEKRSSLNSVRLGYYPEFAWPWIAGTRGLEKSHTEPDRGLAVFGARDLGARGKRGIIEDCCENSCTIDTLMNYC